MSPSHPPLQERLGGAPVREVLLQHPISFVAGAVAACALVLGIYYWNRALNHLTETGSRAWWFRYTNIGWLLVDRKYFTEVGWHYRGKHDKALLVVVAGVLLAIFAW